MLRVAAAKVHGHDEECLVNDGLVKVAFVWPIVSINQPTWYDLVSSTEVEFPVPFLGQQYFEIVLDVCDAEEAVGNLVDVITYDDPLEPRVDWSLLFEVIEHSDLWDFQTCGELQLRASRTASRKQLNHNLKCSIYFALSSGLRTSFDIA